MSTEDNKAMSRRSMLLWDSTTDDNLDAIYAPNYVNHQESDVAGVDSRGLDDFKAFLRAFDEAFSDSRATILQQIAENDLVATHWQVTARQTGPFMGHAPAPDKQITYRGVLIDRFEGGKIVETWNDWDSSSFLSQLGRAA